MVRGASGILDEVDEARRVVERVAEYLRTGGVTVYTFHDNTSTSQNQNLSTIVNWHNSKNRGLDVSVHFNAYEQTSAPMGTECLYVTQQQLASQVAGAISVAGGFINRGPKKRTDLAFLNGTDEPAILIETCFVDSSADAHLYQSHFDAVCHAIAETIGGIDLPDETEPPPETEQPPPEGAQTGTIYGLAPGDSLNIRATASSTSAAIGTGDNDATVTIVGSAYNGDTKWLKIKIEDPGIVTYGWVSAAYVNTGGGAAPEITWREGITATEFGGAGDEQEGAYGGWIDPNKPGLSFPYKWRDGPRPRIVARGPAGEAEIPVVDVGPWNTNDPAYVIDGERPMAEEQYENRTTAQNGMIPTNDAGIDLTPAAARLLGISGKGKVSWRYV
jgi:N-acetylmuramoyl-L-alanine amidase